MKFTFVMLFVCMALFCSTANGRGGCTIRREKKKDKDLWQNRTNEVMCNEPVTLPVALPLTGYRKLTPPVVFVKRCSEILDCSYMPNMRCLPVPNKTRIKSVVVKAKGKKKCTNTTVDIEEHLSCECRCPGEEMCNENQMFMPKLCECHCKTGLRMVCNMLSEKFSPSRHMFDKTTCECKCNKEKECGYGEMFSKDSCKCKSLKDWNQ